jgi:cytochrome P450
MSVADVHASASVPTSDVDLFSDANLGDPYETYAVLRAQGAVVWMSRHDIWALPRYEDVRRALEDHDTFISGKGVGLSEFGNKTRLGTPIASDPPDHGKLRAVVSDRLSLGATRAATPMVQGHAARLVETVIDKKSFDGVSDFARRFPITVMGDLIGLPEDGREDILGWADAGYNLFGPANERTERGKASFEPLGAYLRSLNEPGRLKEGSMGAFIFEAAERGEIRREQCAPLLIAYLMAGLDTTMNAISAGLMFFGRHPEKWDAVRNHPALLNMSFNEIIRLETPFQFLRRVASRDVEIDGTTIPKGATVLMMYGSANRDERRWSEPNAFQPERSSAGHLAFGAGIHLCPGQHMARLEAVSLLSALAARVERFTIGEPEWHLNNVVRGLGHLPVHLH